LFQVAGACAERKSAIYAPGLAAGDLTGCAVKDEPRAAPIRWALLGIFIAFIPATILANWAPTLLGVIAVPLIITRSRISAAKVAESRADRLRYWQPIRSDAEAEGVPG
jgi:hypothetical protein